MNLKVINLQALHEFKQRTALEGPILLVIAVVCSLAHIMPLSYVATGLAVCSYFAHWIAIHRIVSSSQNISTADADKSVANLGPRTLASVPNTPRSS